VSRRLPSFPTCVAYPHVSSSFSPPALFTSGGSLAQHFSTLFHPIASEYDLLGKFPQAAHTIKNVDAYHTALEELRTSISPELELIESRVVGPVRELQGIMKAIRKMITKREHKVSRPASYELCPPCDIAVSSVSRL